MRILLICLQDSSYQKLLEKKYLLFSLTIKDNNSLNPFMDVTLIGELTEGKNVGMEMQKNDKYEWMYWPITLRVTNAVNYDYSVPVLNRI